MLVLTRKAGERIIMADDIEIIVLQSTAGRVRLGIDAPHVATFGSELDGVREQIPDNLLLACGVAGH